jgi:predicted Co/Zn/Cd cation transporter (cation efflux family)
VTALAWVLRGALVALAVYLLVSEIGQLILWGAVILFIAVCAFYAVYYALCLLVAVIRRTFGKAHR